MQSYSWKKDKEGRLIEEPISFNDHAIAALRYAVFSSKQITDWGI